MLRRVPNVGADRIFSVGCLCCESTFTLGMVLEYSHPTVNQAIYIISYITGYTIIRIDYLLYQWLWR
jgi:hypothetical protein